MRNESLSYMGLAYRILKEQGEEIALVFQEGTTAKPMIRVESPDEKYTYYTHYEHDLDFLRSLQNDWAHMMAEEYSTKSTLSLEEMEKRSAEADAWLDQTLTMQGLEETIACMGATTVDGGIDKMIQVQADTPGGKRWLESNNDIKMKWLALERPAAAETEDKETLTETQEQDLRNVHAKVCIIRYEDWNCAAYAAPSDCPNEEVPERGVRLDNSEESELYSLFFEVGMSLKNYSKTHGCLPQGATELLAPVVETTCANVCLVQGVNEDYATYIAPPDWSDRATRQGGHKLRMSKAAFIMKMLVRTGIASERWDKLECQS